MLRKKGFTLVELLVVIIIVGILAAVSIPLMRGNIERAQSTEAVAALGAIRTQMRLILAEWDDYTNDPPGVTVGLVEGNVPGFNANDLDGTYFGGDCYAILLAADLTASTFLITCTGATEAGSAGTTDVVITIDQDGNIVGP